MDNLTLHYGGSQVLYDISLTAAVGQVTCVMGTNGVGKNNLLKAIAGAHPASGGQITLDGAGPLMRLHPPHARAGIGYVPQGRDVFPLLTVRENLEIEFA